MSKQQEHHLAVAAGEEALWNQEFVTQLARALHEYYRRQRATAGDAAARSWDDLPTAFQASNVNHAGHIKTKLTVIGCRAVFGNAPDEEPFGFTDDEVTRLARMEHDRWVEERLDGGWNPGLRDVDHLTTPSLVTWDRLSEEMRDVDRLFVRAIPEVLAELGYRVVRSGDTNV